jgi:hypothetical protein
MKSKNTSRSIGLLLLGFLIVVEIARKRTSEPQQFPLEKGRECASVGCGFVGREALLFFILSGISAVNWWMRYSIETHRCMPAIWW